MPKKMIELKKATESYIELFNDSMKKLLMYSEGIIFKEKNLDFHNMDLDLTDLKFKNAIYLISIENLNTSNSTQICEQVIDLKNNNKIHKFPKVNLENCKVQNNDILYIGKSKGVLQSRINGHLGNGSPSTYALHLSQWKDNDFLKNVKLKLHYAFVKMDDNDIESDILELLETALHKKYKPILGRSGH